MRASIKELTMSNCIFKIGTVTLAGKAKKVLASNSIYVKVVKLSSSASKGCMHGIEFNCNQKSNVIHLLLRESIVFEEYSR